MRTSKLFVSLGIALLSVSVGCKDNDDVVNEDWCLDETYQVPLRIHVNAIADKSFRDYLTIDSTMMNDTQYRSRSTRADPGDMQLQYFVAAYQKGESTPKAVFSSFENPVNIKLHPGKYDLVGFAASSPPVLNSKNHYYHTDDFNEIMLKHKYDYVSNDFQKVPYAGRKFVSVAWTSDEYDLELTPAMAKFRIIATDADSARFVPYKSKISYSLVPAAINGLTGDIVYSWNDIEYETIINQNNEIAIDYVISQDHETEIVAKVEIFDAEGNVCARLTKLRIPLINGGITTIKGNFYHVLDLSGLDSGAISIDKEFEGTVEIEI